jgi:peptidoglycan/xylan/chitin deacetylase (PgdA/CDA1 family)
MRLDRFCTLFLARSVRMLRNPEHGRVVPVLMYHSVSEVSENTSPYFQTATHPDVFARQMRFLRDEGYQGVTLGEALESLKSSRTSGPSKPVAITFDDGFRDFEIQAVPILNRFSFRATMYLPTAYIAEQRRSFKGRECLCWSEVKRLHSDGYEFGSHTVTHPQLIDLDWLDIEAELVESKSTIEEQVGAAISTFAYPYAFPQHDKAFVAQFGQLLAGAGYSNCVTTMVGRVAPRYGWRFLKRLPINSLDDLELFRAKLEGAYDWMGTAQAAVKRMRFLTGGLAKHSRTVGA